MFFPKGVRGGELPEHVTADITEQLHGHFMAAAEPCPEATPYSEEHFGPMNLLLLAIAYRRATPIKTTAISIPITTIPANISS